jgi:hypothetical protein
MGEGRKGLWAQIIGAAIYPLTDPLTAQVEEDMEDGMLKLGI